MNTLPIKRVISKLQKRTKTIMEFKLSAEHGYVVVIVSLFGLQYLWLQRKREQARKDAFTRNIAVLFKHFNEKHKKSFGVNLNMKGDPDLGNNRFSDLLPYKDWCKIGSAELAYNKFIYEACMFVERCNSIHVTVLGVYFC